MNRIEIVQKAYSNDIKRFIIISTMKLENDDQLYDFGDIKGYKITSVSFGSPNAILKAYGVAKELVEVEYCGRNKCIENMLEINGNKGYEFLTRNPALRFYLVEVT